MTQERPIDELENLANKWRANAEVCETAYGKGMSDTFHECADELEALLEEHKNE